MDADDGVDAADGVAADGKAAVIDEWRDHPLWEFLEAELLDYNIPLDVNEMGPTEVWNTYCDREDTAHLFEGMVCDKTFKRRLASLRKQVHANLDRAAMDQLAYDIHRKNFPYEDFDAQRNRNWHGSPAEELLNQNVAQGLYPDMTPAELYATQVEYQEFSLKVFREHIHQCIQTAKYLHTLKARDDEAKAEKQRARCTREEKEGGRKKGCQGESRGCCRCQAERKG